jgi:hypothetical protein
VDQENPHLLKALLRSPVTWGLLVSLVLAFVPALDQSNDDFQTGVILGLCGIAVTILVDQQLRISALRRQMADGTDRAVRQIRATVQQTLPLLQSSEDFRRFASQVCDNWQRVDAKESPFLHQILQDRVREFLGDVKSLGSGAIEIEATKPYSFRSASLTEFSAMLMVHSDDLGYWTTTRGRRYLNRQRQAIAAGELTVERIFVLEDEEIDEAESIISEQCAAGISVLIVRTDELTSGERREHDIDHGVVTDHRGTKMLMRPIPDMKHAGGILSARLERLSYLPGEIQKAERSIAFLRHHAVPVSQVYPSIPGFDGTGQ